MLVLAHETGHHMGATRQLRWSEFDPMPRTIRQRGEHEKIGDAPVMPAAKDPFARMSRSRARDWWKKAEKLVGLESKWRSGRHSLRRKFASDLMDLPLASVNCFTMYRTVLSRTRFNRVW